MSIRSTIGHAGVILLDAYIRGCFGELRQKLDAIGALAARLSFYYV